MSHWFCVKQCHKHHPCKIGQKEPVDSLKTKNNPFFIDLDTKDAPQNEQKQFFVESKIMNAYFFLKKNCHNHMKWKNDEQKPKTEIKKSR